MYKKNHYITFLPTTKPYSTKIDYMDYIRHHSTWLTTKDLAMPFTYFPWDPLDQFFQSLYWHPFPPLPRTKHYIVYWFQWYQLFVYVETTLLNFVIFFSISDPQISHHIQSFSILFSCMYIVTHIQLHIFLSTTPTFFSCFFKVHYHKV